MQRRRMTCRMAAMLCCMLSAASAQPFVLSHSFGSFKHARRISVDPFDRLYICDEGADMAHRFTAEGREEKSIGGQGWDEHQFDRPTGIDARFGIEIYIADYGNHRIQRFDRNFNFIATLRTRESADPSTRFGYPVDLAISRLGEMYILDSENNRIVKVDANAAVQRSFGTIESGRGEVRAPRAIDIGDDDRVYVLEENRITVFDSFGNFLGEIGGGIVTGAAGFCVAGDRLFVVSDDVLYQFTTDGTFRQRTARQAFLGAQEMTEFQDVTYSRNTLYVLTRNAAYVFLTPR